LDGLLTSRKSVLNGKNLLVLNIVTFCKHEYDVCGKETRVHVPCFIYYLSNLFSSGIALQNFSYYIQKSCILFSQVFFSLEFHSDIISNAPFLGIVNGIDVADWDPATDEHIPFHYSIDDISGKVGIVF
jgi:hypothetical protein